MALWKTIPIAWLTIPGCKIALLASLEVACFRPGPHCPPRAWGHGFHWFALLFNAFHWFSLISIHFHSFSLISTGQVPGPGPVGWDPGQWGGTGASGVGSGPVWQYAIGNMQQAVGNRQPMFVPWFAECLCLWNDILVATIYDMCHFLLNGQSSLGHATQGPIRCATLDKLEKNQVWQP